MHVRIEYCGVWNYYPRAASLAADLERTLGVKPELVRGSGGVFEITAGNEVIFSKKKSGRFPEPGEIEEKLSQKVGAS